MAAADESSIRSGIGLTTGRIYFTFILITRETDAGWEYNHYVSLAGGGVGGGANATRFSSCENSAKIVGQTPWSARVPLDPLFATGSISSKREGRLGGRPRTGGPPHDF